MYHQSNGDDSISAESNQLGKFIPLHYHHLMLSDRARTGAFAEAIAKLVRPGQRVLELGGGTGILSFLAARCGASVTYVEFNPELYEFAKHTLQRNDVGENVHMVLADAAKYLPQEPVDFVICEMLHSAMLREKQLNVLAKFRANYLAMLSPTLPRFIPEVAFLAVQPVQHPYDFFGYNCPIPVFQDALTVHPDTVELGDPVIYSSIDYAQHIPLRLQWRGAARVSRGGRLTALRFVTKNILAVLTDESRAIDWHNAYLLLPLPEPIDVETGTQLSIRFDYPAGAPIAALAESMRVEILPDAPQVTIRPRQGVVVAE